MITSSPTNPQDEPTTSSTAVEDVNVHLNENDETKIEMETAGQNEDQPAPGDDQITKKEDGNINEDEQQNQ